MRVFVIYGGVSGVEFHRLYNPFVSMSEDGLDVKMSPTLDGITQEEYDLLAKEFDVVVFNRNVSAKMTPQVVFDNLKRRGVKIVVDVDDYWYLPKHHVLSKLYKQSAFPKCVMWQIRNADEVWSSTKILAGYISKLNRNVHVMKNAIDPKRMPKEKVVKGDKPFYQGSVTHKVDLELIKDLPITVCGVGYVDEKVDPEWQKIIDMMPNAEFEDGEPSPLDHYKVFNEKGVCVIPLVHNKFSMCKSNLKMLEAGWYEKPIIVSNVPPYDRTGMADKTHIAINDPKDFGNALERLKNSPERQQELVANMLRVVENNYMIDQVNELRRDRLWKLLKRK